MKKYIIPVIIISFLTGVIGVRVLFTKIEEKKSFYEHLGIYLEAPEKFQGLPSKVKVVRYGEDSTQTINLLASRGKWTLLLYFRVDDCEGCLKELKALKDTFDLKLNVLVAIDHPVSWEVKYVLQALSLKEAIWDSSATLLGSHVRGTPIYFLIKGKSIKEIGIIALLKETSYEKGTSCEKGAFAHFLKEKFKKYDF